MGNNQTTEGFNEFQSIYFFRDIHRAEIFNTMPLGKMFEMILLEGIKELLESKTTLNQNGHKNLEINNCSDAFKYLHDQKLNYMTHYRLYFSNY